MPLEKQTIQLTFQGGIDTIDDPNNMPVGKFVSLTNTQFIKRGDGGVSSLEKRNGFGPQTQSVGTMSFLTTFNNNLVGIGQSTFLGQVPIGTSVISYSAGADSWVNSGAITPVQLNTQPLIRNTYSQSAQDSASAPNGLVCVAYDTGELSPQFRFAILDAATGQNVINPRAITSSGGTQLYPAKVFYFNNKFVLAYDVLNSANTVSSFFFLQLLTIPTGTPSSTGSVTTIASQCYFQAQGSFDGIVSSGSIFFSWNTGSAIGANVGIQSTFVNNNMVRSTTTTTSSGSGLLFSVCADDTVGSNSTIYTSFSIGTANASGNIIKFVALDSSLASKFTTRTATASGSNAMFLNLASTAQGGNLLTYGELSKNYVYNAALPSNAIDIWSVSSAGAVGVESNISRCLGLASKGFLTNSTSYVLGTYQSNYQSTYFLLNSGGSPVAMLSYGNGSGYRGRGVASVTLGSGNAFNVSYLNRDTITPVNKGTNLSATTQTVGIYSSFGINLASVDFGLGNTVTKDAGQALNINGGFLWSYDGLRATENNFFLYPDDVKLALSALGTMSAQTYFYQTTYEYTDNQGNLYRSAPSIPVSIATTGSAISIQGPNLRLTYKGTPNFPTVNIYRWSTAQQTYYKISPPIVSTAAQQASDSFLAIDAASDASILGNEILYTNGGVVEDTAAPGSNTMAMFDSRLWLVDAEDKNLLWFSKQIIEAVPVEMSDLLTYFVQPNAGTQGSTGPIRAIAPMDDKLIVFKRNAIYYINGKGPDNTGANNQYSDPIFINGSIGCLNKNSVVLIPNGLMFQSDNGIWLLGRDLSLNFIGKDVEDFNNSNVTSSIYIPGTSEVRFTLDTGEVLVFDYAVGDWGVNYGISAISSTLYKNLHTYVNSSNSIFQETVGAYTDGSTPTAVSFTTGWINMAGLQGYARLYALYMLGKFQSPHQLQVSLAYDYDPEIKQTATINPLNTIGSGSYVEQWQINVARQQCQAFQLSVNEIVTGSSGAGVSISGFNMVVGLKKSYPKNIAPKNRVT